jgi:hypothetical protein
LVPKPLKRQEQRNLIHVTNGQVGSKVIFQLDLPGLNTLRKQSEAIVDTLDVGYQFDAFDAEESNSHDGSRFKKETDLHLQATSLNRAYRAA